MELPAGFRFEPTDEELILSCLYSKISGQPLDTDAVATVNVYTTEPWNLLPEDVAEFYFFTPMARKYNRGARPDRTAGRGTWIAYKVESVISCDGDVVGRKRCLSFGVAEKQNTGWTMYEYELAFGSSSRETQFHEWVLCLIKRPPPRCVTNGAVCSRRRKRKRDSGSPMPDDATILRVDGGGGGGGMTSAIAGVVDPFTHEMIIQEEEAVDPFALDQAAVITESAEDGTVMINSADTAWSSHTSVLPAKSPMAHDATILLSSGGGGKEKEYSWDIETAITQMMQEEEVVDPFAWDQAAVMTPSAEDGTMMIKFADTTTSSCTSFLPAESWPLMPVDVDDATILGGREEDQYLWDFDLIGLELLRPVPAECPSDVLPGPNCMYSLAPTVCTSSWPLYL